MLLTMIHCGGMAMRKLNITIQKVDGMRDIYGSASAIAGAAAYALALRQSVLKLLSIEMSEEILLDADLRHARFLEGDDLCGECKSFYSKPANHVEFQIEPSIEGEKLSREEHEDYLRAIASKPLPPKKRRKKSPYQMRVLQGGKK